MIHHDWIQTIDRVKKLLPLTEHVKSERHGNATHFLMKSLGTISEHWDSKSWYRVAGPSVEQTMPWIHDLLSCMAELQPDDSCISILDGAAESHIDLPEIPSALNYIFYTTDSEAHTWLKDGSVIETHPSTVGSAWIIDTQKEHGVVNNGIRYSLSIHFKADYQTIKQWFNSQTQSSLTFGS